MQCQSVHFEQLKAGPASLKLQLAPTTALLCLVPNLCVLSTIGAVTSHELQGNSSSISSRWIILRWEQQLKGYSTFDGAESLETQNWSSKTMS